MELIDNDNICMRIYEYYEYRHRIENGRTFNKIIKEFTEHFNISIDFSMLDIPYDYGKGLSYGYYLIQLYWLDKRYNEYLFYLLDKYHFNLYELMYEVIKNIGNNIEIVNKKDYINALVSLPFIDDIICESESRYTIYSSKLGNFTFDLFNSQYKCSYILRYYLGENRSINCHENVLMLTHEFPDFNLITSLCSDCFGKTNYHSYTKDGNRIIDLCAKVVMDIEDYSLLHKPKEIVNIPNRNVEQRATVANHNTKLPNNWLIPIKIALYEQYLCLQENKQELNKILAYDIKKDKNC